MSIASNYFSGNITSLSEVQRPRSGTKPCHQGFFVYSTPGSYEKRIARSQRLRRKTSRSIALDIDQAMLPTLERPVSSRHSNTWRALMPTLVCVFPRSYLPFVQRCIERAFPACPPPRSEAYCRYLNHMPRGSIDMWMWLADWHVTLKPLRSAAFHC
jgi:hypothetical protein